MIAENAFTEKEKTALETSDLSFEMAVATEWIVRDNNRPDNLMLVYVAPSETEDELQAACSCDDGALDKPCLHALGVLREIRAQNHILHQIFNPMVGREPAQGTGEPR